MDSKLAEERGHVNLHGALAELEDARDLLVGPALYDQIQNIPLPAGQCGPLLCAAGRSRLRVLGGPLTRCLTEGQSCRISFCLADPVIGGAIWRQGCVREACVIVFPARRRFDSA